MTNFLYGAINTAEALRLSERAVTRADVVADVQLCRDAYGSASKTASMLNVGESTIYNVVSGASSISETLLDGLYGREGKTLRVRHQEAIGGATANSNPQDAVTAAPPVRSDSAAVVSRSDAQPASPDAPAVAVADRGADAVPAAPLPDTDQKPADLAHSIVDALAQGGALTDALQAAPSAAAGYEITGRHQIEIEPQRARSDVPAANDDADWLEPALAALDRRLHHLCAVEADALTLLGRARAEMTKIYNARTLLRDLAGDPLPDADAAPERIAAE